MSRIGKQLKSFFFVLVADDIAFDDLDQRHCNNQSLHRNVEDALLSYFGHEIIDVVLGALLV